MAITITEADGKLITRFQSPFDVTHWRYDRKLGLWESGDAEGKKYSFAEPARVPDKVMWAVQEHMQSGRPYLPPMRIWSDAAGVHVARGLHDEEHWVKAGNAWSLNGERVSDVPADIVAAASPDGTDTGPRRAPLTPGPGEGGLVPTMSLRLNLGLPNGPDLEQAFVGPDGIVWMSIPEVGEPPKQDRSPFFQVGDDSTILGPMQSFTIDVQKQVEEALRDNFAMLALQGIIASEPERHVGSLLAARQAYDYADAMLHIRRTVPIKKDFD